jgi:hypothetical protein
MAGNVWVTIMLHDTLFQSGKVTKNPQGPDSSYDPQYSEEFIEEVLFYVQMNIVQDTWWDLEEVERVKSTANHIGFKVC